MILNEIEDALDEQLGLFPMSEIDGIDVLVASLKSLRDENLEQVDGDAGVLRQPVGILFDQLVDDVDGLEFDFVEDLRGELRRWHARQVVDRHVHQLRRVPLKKRAKRFT